MPPGSPGCQGYPHDFPTVTYLRSSSEETLALLAFVLEAQRDVNGNQRLVHLFPALTSCCRVSPEASFLRAVDRGRGRRRLRKSRACVPSTPGLWVRELPPRSAGVPALTQPDGEGGVRPGPLLLLDVTSGNGLVDTRRGFASAFPGPALQPWSAQQNGLVSFGRVLSPKLDVEDRKASPKGHGYMSGLQKQGPCSGTPLPPAPGL